MKSIIHVPETYFVAIRQDYLGICRDMKHPHCAAALLNMFEQWHNGKLDAFKEELRKYHHAKSNGQRYVIDRKMWTYMTQSEMRTDALQGLFGESLIARSLQDLRDAGYIKSRNNPKNNWDRTLQYLFIAGKVQRALFTWAHSDYAPIRINTASKAYRYGIEALPIRKRGRKNGEAIPKTLSKNAIREGGKEVVVKQSLRVVEPPRATFEEVDEATYSTIPRNHVAFEQQNNAMSHPWVRAYSEIIGAKAPYQAKTKEMALIAQYAGKYSLEAFKEYATKRVRERPDVWLLWILQDMPRDLATSQPAPLPKYRTMSEADPNVTPGKLLAGEEQQKSLALLAEYKRRKAEEARQAAQEQAS